MDYYTRVLKKEEELGQRFDISKDNGNDRKWKKGVGHQFQWLKIGYIWRKFEDRYGTTWYPRCRWVQHTRWEGVNRKLTWDEMVEDMSIAVGEDLFPFFVKCGTSLKKKRLESIKFQGKILKLKPAPIKLTPPGPADYSMSGDYRKPITPKQRP